MALNKLTALQVVKISKPGRYLDGGGLYLNVYDSGVKAWEYRFTINKKTRYMGLGAYDKNLNSLAHARDRCAVARALVKRRLDPIIHGEEEKLRLVTEVENKERQQRKQEELQKATFKRCAADFIETKKAEWKNAKHRSQWENTLRDYVYPYIGEMPINDIDVSHIRQCLDSIWLTKTETASRVRQRIETVISYAIANNLRGASKGNPAIWKGLLENFYPNAEKVKRLKHLEAGTDGHFAALPYAELPSFMAKLVKLTGYAPLALRFLILTVPRTTELRLATWNEVDFDKKMWVIPAGRMKASKRHRIPLSDAAIKLLEGLPRGAKTDFIFPGWKHGTALSEGGLSSVLRIRMGIDKKLATVHGFRSTFRDYIGEETGFPDRLAEFALAHQLTDEAERAYARGDKLIKRFEMMNAWANYCDSKLKIPNN